MANEVLGLFPTPVMRVQKLLPRTLVDALVEHFKASARTANAKSDLLSHTEMFTPDSHAMFAEVSEKVAPKLGEFGDMLFGERLPWFIKEMWVNVLETGGRQSMHNHANSFISGVLYLTRCHPSATTVFLKSPGGHQYEFSNANENTTMGPFNAGKFAMPEPSPGDLILFPSYVLHEVPVNAGSQRISLAFNAVPERLDSWGYRIRFSK